VNSCAAILWQKLGDARRAPTRHNCHFIKWINIGEHHCDQRMSSFMVGYHASLVFVHQGFAPATQGQFVEGLLETATINLCLAPPCCHEIQDGNKRFFRC